MVSPHSAHRPKDPESSSIRASAASTRASTPERFRFRDEAIACDISAKGWTSSSFPTAVGSSRADSGAMSPAARISALSPSSLSRWRCNVTAFTHFILADATCRRRAASTWASAAATTTTASQSNARGSSTRVNQSIHPAPAR